MDIVFLITCIVQAGAETQLVRITTTLRRRGWRVKIVAMLPPTYTYPDLGEAGVPVEQLPGHPRRTPWRMIAGLVHLLRRERPTILVTFNYPADVLGRLCGRLARTPVILPSLRTAHLKTPLRGFFYRVTDWMVTLTVSNSRAALAMLTGKGILAPRRTRFIPNGMLLGGAPLPERGLARAELGLPADIFLWVAVGNLREAKDYPNLLRAVARCPPGPAPFRVLVAGGGALAQDLAGQARSLGLGDRVDFLGPRDDVPRLLAAADAYVLPSAWEGTPNTLMEAMAAGLPAVATRVGDVDELLQGEAARFVVPPGDSAALAQAMGTLMELSTQARHDLGEAGRRRIHEGFDNERVVDQWESLFLEMGASPGQDGRAT